MPHRWAVAVSTGGLPVRGVATGYHIIACCKLRVLVSRAGQGEAGTGQEQQVTLKKTRQLKKPLDKT